MTTKLGIHSPANQRRLLESEAQYGDHHTNLSIELSTIRNLLNMATTSITGQQMLIDLRHAHRSDPARFWFTREEYQLGKFAQWMHQEGRWQS